jgi:predicted dehydrogenase
LLPALADLGVAPVVIAAPGGLSASLSARSFGAARATSEIDEAIHAPDVDTVFVLTRHDSHADLVCRALAAGKHVFVEKPLAVTDEEVDRIEAKMGTFSISASEIENVPFCLLMVGFNRRFAPQVLKMRELLAGVREPKAFVMTVNAGAIPPEHWTQDAEAGGGRIVGEACHFIDLLRHLAGAAITSHHVSAIRGVTGPTDRATITLGFADGSIGTVHYLSNGHRAFPKERLEVFAGGRVLQLDNFRRLRGYGWPGFSRMNLWRQDKGQDACVKAFVEAVRAGGPSPIPLEELLEVARLTIAIARAAHA